MPLREDVREAELLVYGNACPNCGGYISDRRLKLGAPCTSCLATLPSKLEPNEIRRALKEAGTLRSFREYYRVFKIFNELAQFFKKCVGNDPWSIQNLWLRRIAKESSFAMIAPTGVGKTTFGLVVALYLAMKGQKSYIVVPTTTLAMQAEKKLEELASRADIIAHPLVIHSKLKKKEKEAREEMLEDSDSFDILVTTSNYLIRNPDKVLKHNFKFIFVDDVDAVLKGSKAINYLLKLSGFDDKDIEEGLKAIRIKRELAFRGEDPKLLNELNKIKAHLESKRKRSKKILIIASATGNPRGTRVRLFRELMGFEIGARPEFIRNIEDVYKLVKKDEIPREVLNLVKRLGHGGLVYVPIDAGIEFANKLAEYLSNHGVPAQAMHSKNLKAIDAFIAGEIQVLVGVATYYGVLVRGLDLPEIIRYAVFAGPPRHKVGLRLAEARPQDVLRLLPLVRDAIVDTEVRKKIEAHIVRLRRLVRRAGPAIMGIFEELLKGEKSPQTSGEKEFLDAFNLIKDLLSNEEVIDSIKRNPNVAVIEQNGELYVLIPDAPTYIQASGRTSRLFLGGISKGLSIVLADDERLLRGLERRLKWVIDDFKFKLLDEVDLDSILKEINRSRELIRSVRKGAIPKEITEGTPLQLKTALLVVESPNKARTIAKFFGRPSVREYGRLRVYEVNLGNYTLLITASGGHIYDVVTDVKDPTVKHIHGIAIKDENTKKFIPIYNTIKRCLENGHQFVVDDTNLTKVVCPVCGSHNIFDTKTTIEAIRDVAQEVDEILVGTDPDTEGEKIAFDITNIVLPINRNVKRVEFHEITRRAITNAIYNPRTIDFNLVKAQLVRRIEDRWLGFSLSERLQTDFWRRFCTKISKLKKKDILYKRYHELCEKFRTRYRNLSAGRVQTPVLGWIIEAYDNHVKSKTLFLILNIGELRVEIPLPQEVRKKLRRRTVDKVTAEVSIDSVSEEEVYPLPPYTTDSVLYDISSKFRMPAQKAMQILQELFELGFITYHRTDSTRVSDAGIAVAREYMKEKFGEEYSKYFQPRTWGEGGAHECIRPTRPVDAETLRNLISEGIIEPVRRLTKAHYIVYDLIFKRFMASQSKPSLVKRVKGKVKAKIYAGENQIIELEPTDFEVVSEVLFEGFSMFYKYFYPRKVPDEGTYELTNEFELREWYTHPLHTQATLVKTMKEKEIGRPSTYAKIVDTLFKRRYVAFDKSKSKGIVPLPLGREVYDYLISNYSELVNEERTRTLEKRMSEVEEGKVDYDELINELYSELLSFKLVKEVPQ